MRQFRNIKSLLLVTVTLILQSCSSTNERHIGEWKTTDEEGKLLNIILDKSNHVLFVQDNIVSGGKDFMWYGYKGEWKYEIDYSKDPVWLDFILYDKAKNEELTRNTGIIRFITDNKIECRMDWFGIDEKRFTTFDSEDKFNTMVLDKVTK